MGSVTSRDIERIKLQIPDLKINFRISAIISATLIEATNKGRGSA